ncbi:Protein phosphatase 1K, mitochondrial, partial [Ophiophagus hannah]
MSTAALIGLVRNRGQQLQRALLTSCTVLGPRCQISTNDCRASRFDLDGSGCPATWDSFGIWDNRLDEPILLPPSIKYGKLIPKVSLSKVGCATHIGKRKENEDRFDYGQLTEEVLYFAIFDGHGGVAAADFCNNYMRKYIREFLSEERNMELVLIKAFLEIDKAYMRHAHLSADATLLNTGSTATVALLRDGIELVVASVGDSRALLCRKGKAKKLTIDHTPERKDEKESDSFLVLTTDGINFMVNSQEICDFVNQCHDPTEAAHIITEQAMQYGTEDNSTAIVVPFGAWGKYKNSEINFSFSRGFGSSGRWA